MIGNPNLLNTNVLYEWVQTGLLSPDGVLLESKFTKLKIQLLQKLILLIREIPDTAERISDIINTHHIFD